MQNGLFVGGPLDGKVIESESDIYFSTTGNCGIDGFGLGKVMYKKTIMKKCYGNENGEMIPVVHEWYEWHLA